MFLRMVARPLMAKVNQTTGIKKVSEKVNQTTRIKKVSEDAVNQTTGIKKVSEKVNQTTGIKKVSEDAREVLIGLYNRILNEIKKLPEDTTYREQVEIDTEHKLKICEEEEDVESIPTRLYLRQFSVEKLIEEARRELNEITGLTQTTGIKKVSEDAREVLIGLYNRILNEIKKLPEDITYREQVEIDTEHKLKICEEEEDVESIPARLYLRQLSVEKLIEEARRELNEITGSIADWQDCQSRPPSLHPLPLYWKPSEREMLIQLYNKALKVVRTVPKNNKLRIFAESSITRKLNVCKVEDNWESLKSELGYEDPVQKAQEELDHWTLFFGPDAHPNRLYPHLPHTKEFCERFDAWRELASQMQEILKSRKRYSCCQL